MKKPAFLDNKEDVIVFEGKISARGTHLAPSSRTLTLSGTKTAFLYIEDDDGETISIHASASSAITLYLILKTSSNSKVDLDITVEPGSKMAIFSVLRKTEPVQIDLKRVFHVKAQASLSLANAWIDMGETFVHDEVHLEEPHASVDIAQLNIGAYNDRFHVNQHVFHEAKQTSSSIDNSLISHANAVLNYTVAGTIFKGNELSSCQQNNKGIILDEKGEIEVQPQLFIDEYNVDAGHGAAIGQIDEEQLYYLYSRGLTEDQARSLIISGYTKPFVNQIEDEDVKALVERQILKRIQEENIL